MPTSGWTGVATLNVLTNDLGNTGDGGALNDSDAVAIAVRSTFTSGTQTVSQGTSLATGREWIITRDGTGAQSLAVVSSDYTDTGTYRVDGAMVCSKWVKRSDETCAEVFQLPDGKYQAANEKGEMLAEFTVSTGS